MRLSALDSIQHGLLNLRANWQLVVVLFVQTLVVSAISLVGLVPIVLVLGFAFLRGVMSAFDSSGGGQLRERILEAGIPLILAFLAAGLIWTIAFVVYCYFQGGVLGTLAAGERRAISEGVRWQSYREFSVNAFCKLAEGLTWPIFWLLNLFVLMGLAALTAFGVVAAGLFVLLREGSGAVQFVLGCSVFLVLVIAMILLAAWMQLALAEIVTGTRSALAAARRALGIAGRRFPGVALLFLLLFVASIVLAIILVPVSMVLEMALRERMMAYLTGQALVTLAQWLSSGFLTVVGSATLVALVIGEHEATA